MLALILATALSAEAAAPVPALRAGEARLAQESDDEDWGAPRSDEEDRRRVRIGVWGGDALGSAGSGRSSGFAGGEAAWAFDSIDVGVSGSWYRDLRDATRTWTPVVLARFTQRFKTRRGVEAAFGFGLGAGDPRGWRAWYQVALGVRLPLGPMFLAGELAFEQYDLLRLGGGLGFAF